MIEFAIASLRPGAVWNLHGYDYSGLEWRDETQTKPTEEEVNAEIEKIKLKRLEEKEAKEKAKASAIEKLTALGLNIDEIKSLSNLISE